MNEWIAATEILGIRPDGERITIKVGIGIPFQKEEESWSCPIYLSPLYSRLANSEGGDALQSICLALALILDLLQDFREKGGRLVFEDGTDIPLESYAFGFALNKGKDVTPPKSKTRLPDLDDGLRGGHAVGVSLDKRDEQFVRLVLDDLQAGTDPTKEWRQNSFYTFIDLAAGDAYEDRLSEKQYAWIGKAILWRLLALHSTYGDNRPE